MIDFEYNQRIIDFVDLVGLEADKTASLMQILEERDRQLEDALRFSQGGSGLATYSSLAPSIDGVPSGSINHVPIGYDGNQKPPRRPGESLLVLWTTEVIALADNLVYRYGFQVRPSIEGLEGEDGYWREYGRSIPGQDISAIVSGHYLYQVPDLPSSEVTIGVQLRYVGIPIGIWVNTLVTAIYVGAGTACIT